jgi:hypothetical protein
VHFNDTSLVIDNDDNSQPASDSSIVRDPYQWLHDNYPTAEIWDSEEEDRETWLKRVTPPAGVSIEDHERWLQHERRLQDKEAHVKPPTDTDDEEKHTDDLRQPVEAWHDLSESGSGSSDSDGSEYSEDEDDVGEEPGLNWDAFEKVVAGVSAFDKLGEKFEAEVLGSGT